jgi:hypothetical protein
MILTLSQSRGDFCHDLERQLPRIQFKYMPVRRLVRRQSNVLAQPLRDEGFRDVAAKFYSACS